MSSTPPSPKPASKINLGGAAGRAGGGPPQNRLPLILGLGALTFGAFYYINTSKAKKNDTASGRLKESSPGKTEIQFSAEEKLAKVGSAIDRTVDEGKQRISEATQKLEQKTEEIKQPVLEKIDNVDKKIEKEASKVKGGISSWFGGK